jgi:hypothetical protein
MNLRKLLELFLMMGYMDEEQGGIGDIDTLSEDKEDDNEDSEGDEKDEDIEEEDSEESDEEESDDEDDLEEDESEDESEDGEDEEDDEDPDATGDVKAIKTKYKDFFKEFPNARAALYRDQQYAELLGSPKDAESIVKKAGILDKVEEDLFVNHDPSELLESLAKTDKDALENVAFEVMRWTQKNNKDLYFEMAALPIKQLLRSAWREGNGTKTDLGRAAAYIHKHFFNNTDINDKVKIEDAKAVTKDGKSKAQEAYERKLNQLEQREYDNFKGSVDQSYVRKMTAHIEESLDKDERLTPWMKGQIVKAALEEIKNQLDNDSRYTNHIGGLWKQARTSEWSNDFKSRIVSTALARAKSLVPEIRKKLVAEALGKKVKKDKETTDNKVRKFRKVESSGKRPETREPKPFKSDADILRGA